MLGIDVNTFYKIGVWCFGIVAIMNSMSFAANLLYHTFPYSTDVVSAFASLVFNWALLGFFLYLYSNLPPKNLKPAKFEEMEAIFND